MNQRTHQRAGGVSDTGGGGAAGDEDAASHGPGTASVPPGRDTASAELLRDGFEKSIEAPPLDVNDGAFVAAFADIPSAASLGGSMSSSTNTGPPDRTPCSA